MQKGELLPIEPGCHAMIIGGDYNADKIGTVVRVSEKVNTGFISGVDLDGKVVPIRLDRKDNFWFIDAELMLGNPVHGVKYRAGVCEERCLMRIDGHAPDADDYDIRIGKVKADKVQR